MSKNQPTKEEQIRADVLEVARKLFQQYGLMKTTMEDIAKALRKGKSTLYYYYKSKEEIFEDVVNNEIREVFHEIREAVKEGRTGEEKLRIYFMTVVNSIQKRILLYRIMKGEIGENLKTIVNLKCKIDNNEILFIKEILSFGMERNEWVHGVENDLDLLSYAIVSALRSISLDLVVEDRFPDWDQRITVLREIFLRGLKR